MKSCTICKSAISPPSTRYCSQACARAAHNLRRRVKPRRHKCKRCRAWFTPTRHGHVLCSAACRQAVFRERKSHFNPHAVGLAALRDDLSRIPSYIAEVGFTGRILQNPEDEAAAIAAQQAMDRQQVDDELKRAGIDPRPFRRDGRAVKFA